LCRSSRKCPLAGGADGRSLIAIEQAPRPPNEGAAMKKNEPRAFAAGQPVPCGSSAVIGQPNLLTK
jgi:hypothetical protein